MDVNPDQARYLRKKKQLENQLELKDRDEFDDDDDKGTKEILKNQEKRYKEDEKKFGQADHEKEEYFGYKIEPFSMKDDREVGKIHEDGFVEIRRTKEMRDPWLDSLEESKNSNAPAKRPAKEESSDDDTPLDPKEIFHLTKELFDLLHPGETPNQALSRLRPAQAKPQQRVKKNVRKSLKTEENSEQHNLLGKGKTESKGESEEAKPDSTNKEQEVDEEKKKVFDRIVEICDILCGNGYMNVFTDTRERIQNRFMTAEDELIKHDLEDEGAIEDMNPDHNVIEE